MLPFNWSDVPQVGADDAGLDARIDDRIARLENRLARIQAAKAEMAMAGTAQELALATQLIPELAQAENRLTLLKQQLLQLQTYLHQPPPPAPPAGASRKDLGKHEAKLAQKAAERANKIAAANTAIDQITNAGAAQSLQQVGAVVAQCAVPVKQHAYPAPDQQVADLCDAISQQLTANAPVLQRADGGTVFQGKSIAVAKLANGRFVVAISGAQDYATQVVNALDFGNPPTFQGHPVTFQTGVVPNLAAHMEAPPTLAPLGARACAMPKAYRAAADAGSAITHVTEIWWPDGNTPNPDDAEPQPNPYPDPANPARMVPCEYCAWNRQEIQDMPNWH